ncbi:hypothetical protein EVAR_101076_1 [Eumeta japonica]|uniref:Uncharacterized protein n=1 Tax=Eumeta variegata TaxID=151549 RepID=A0A4C2AFU1_EUMVA|nr:hypothetical protein EVAR_101076_1 [Eumeta japonica]
MVLIKILKYDSPVVNMNGEHQPGWISLSSHGDGVWSLEVVKIIYVMSEGSDLAMRLSTEKIGRHFVDRELRGPCIRRLASPHTRPRPDTSVEDPTSNVSVG